MGRIKVNRVKRERRTGPPPGTAQELARLHAAWGHAVDTGLLLDGDEVTYISAPTGVISHAVGADGQPLIDGHELTLEWAAELRRTKPEFAGLIDVSEETSRNWIPISRMGPCEHHTCDCTTDGTDR